MVDAIRLDEILELIRKEIFVLEHEYISKLVRSNCDEFEVVIAQGKLAEAQYIYDIINNYDSDIGSNIV